MQIDQLIGQSVGYQSVKAEVEHLVGGDGVNVPICLHWCRDGNHDHIQGQGFGLAAIRIGDDHRIVPIHGWQIGLVGGAIDYLRSEGVDEVSFSLVRSRSSSGIFDFPGGAFVLKDVVSVISISL